jgi:LysM repeat protein
MDVRKLSRPRVLGWCIAALVALAPLVPSAHAARPEAKGLRYTVASGDSLWTIAQAHGCRVDELRRANSIDPGDPLIAGTRLVVPACKGTPGVRPVGKQHRVAAGDTLSSIATRYGTSIEDLRALNGLQGDVIHPGQRLAVTGGAVEPTIRLVAGQSIGRPQRGSLTNGVQLPRSAQYYRRRPEWAYGAQHVVDHTLSVIAEVNRAHPKVHRLAIGDISSPKGGILPGHGSHQSGRDIDLGLYYLATPAKYPDEFVSVDHAKLDAAATWTLVEALWEASRLPGGPELVFLDYDVQGALYKHARKLGVSKSTLKKIFQYPDGKWAQGRLVQHVAKHDDHIHVRFECPPRDEKCR